MKFQTKKLVLSALFMALTCVATMSIRIPTPGTGGYIHPGDAIVILSGALLACMGFSSCRNWLLSCRLIGRLFGLCSHYLSY